MKTIHKHILTVGVPKQLISLHDTAEILDVQWQGNQLVLWEQHDIEYTERIIAVAINSYGTGWVVDRKSEQYIATIQDGGLVWHIFRGIPI